MKKLENKVSKKWSNFPEMWNWHIEEEEGWFVEYRLNILCKYDMRNKSLAAVSAIPANKRQPFQNPWCIKYGNLVYCIPEYESCIWCYNIFFDEWRKIAISTNQNISVMALSLGIQEDIYYFYSINCGYIYGLELKTGVILHSYHINMSNEICVYVDGILSGDSVYFLFEGNLICEFNLNLHKETRYDLRCIDDEVCEIGFDGSLFILTGKKKQIYMWDKESNEIEMMNNLPESFMTYDFWEKREVVDCNDIKKSSDMFSAIKFLNNKVWLIPKAGNEILYYEHGDKSIIAFSLRDEKENVETLDLHFRAMAMKFYLVYVRKNQFLGIYSYKNKCIWEINTIDMSYKRLDCLIDEQSLLKLVCRYFHEENGVMSDLIYSTQTKYSGRLLEKPNIREVGKEIYSQTCI